MRVPVALTPERVSRHRPASPYIALRLDHAIWSRRSSTAVDGRGQPVRLRLELRGAIRPFNYASINDIVTNISYTTDDNASLRTKLESSKAAVEGLLNYLTNHAPARV